MDGLMKFIDLYKQLFNSSQVDIEDLISTLLLRLTISTDLSYDTQLLKLLYSISLSKKLSLHDSSLIFTHQEFLYLRKLIP